MNIGKKLLVKNGGRVQEGLVVKIYNEDLEIKLDDGTLIIRKFWEVRNAPFNNPKEEL